MDYQIKADLKQAHWITVPEQLWQAADLSAYSGIRTACFQLVFTLQTLPAAFPVQVSAASRYRCWLNGRPLASGPCKGDRWRQYYDTLDLAGGLVSGTNVLSVQVVAFAAPAQSEPEKISPIWSEPAPAGPQLILASAASTGSDMPDSRQGDLPDLTTGSAPWRVCLHHGQDWQSFDCNKWAGAMEIIRADKTPAGWPDQAGAETEFLPARKLLQAGYNEYGERVSLPLMPRPIPLLYEKPGKFVRPVQLSEQDPGKPFTLVLDAGRLTTAFFQLAVSGGRQANVVVRYSESYVVPDDQGNLVKGKRDDQQNGRLAGAEDIFCLDGRDFVFAPFLMRTFRYIQITVEPGLEPLRRMEAGFRETGYPLADQASLDASADWVRPVWDLSRHTLQCCMHDTYEDCPYYEQLQYTLDTRLQMLFTYRLAADTRMALRTIEDFHASRLPEGMLQSRYPSQMRQIIPIFSLHWIFMLEDYYWQTADKDILSRYLPTADGLIAWFMRKCGDSGLIEHLGYWDFLDWTREWDPTHGVPDAASLGPVTVHNLTLAVALRSLAWLHAELHADGRDRRYRQLAETICEKINQYCWNEQEGLYQDGPQCGQLSQHAQVWSVLAGAAGPERARQIMQTALDRSDLVQCSFPQQFFLFRALEKAGLYKLTLKQWKLWQDLLPLNLTTIPEVPYDPRSECHAWGSLLLFEGPACFLGVEPGQPGWRSIRIAPRCDFLADARGSAATPHGPVEVTWAWHDRSRQSLQLSARCPDGVPVTLVLPDGQVYEYPQGGHIKVGPADLADTSDPA